MIKWTVTVFAFSLLLIFSLDQQNRVMEGQMKIERAKREKKTLEEKNDQMMLAIASIYHPKRLLSELSSGEFSHLMFPQTGEVIYMEPEKE